MIVTLIQGNPMKKNSKYLKSLLDLIIKDRKV